MKAINENIVKKDRNRLEEVLPLDTPYSVVIDPCNRCNFRCKFCAMQATDRKQSFNKMNMNINLFKKIIDDLTKFPNKLKVLRISGQGEPLLNPFFCEMVQYAKNSNVSEWIETVTNGSLLKPELNQKISESGLDRIRISIEALDINGYERVAGVKLDVNKLIKNIKDLYDRCNGKVEIYIKIVDAEVPRQEDKLKFYDLFGDICDKIYIDKVIPLWSDFSEINNEFDIDSEVGIHGQKVQNIMVCPFPFYSLIINSDGDVTVCCADWQRKLVVGNVVETSIVDIWNGEKYHDFLVNMLMKNKNTYEMCQKCVLPMYDCNDNIDAFASQILERMK